MQWLFLGIVAIGLLLVAVNAFMRANPRDLANTIRQGIGYSALAIALILAIIGRIGLAVPLAALGFMVLRGRLPFGGGFPGSARPTPGQTSRVRTPTLEMTLEHDTGAMDGAILKGKFAGQRMTALGLDQLLEIRRECQAGDLKALPLIEAFLDRNHQGWRVHAGAEGASSEGAGLGGTKSGAGGPMTRAEAYEILGLESGASSDLIRRAHRQLMKRLHPDQGGSNYLAAKVNEAKDLLLSN